MNCDGGTNSLDAVLVLQLDAALVGGLPCEEGADANQDGAVNSNDAALILQLEAGLLDRFFIMDILVTTVDGTCDQEPDPASCDIPAGGEFDVTVALLSTPPQGYIAFQTWLYFGMLDYLRSDSVGDEILWPDSALSLRTSEESEWIASVGHGSVSTVTPPFAVSEYTGPMVAIRLSCPSVPLEVELALIGYDPERAALGALLSLPNQEIVYPLRTQRRDIDLDLDGDLAGVVGRPETDLPIADSVQIHCGVGP